MNFDNYAIKLQRGKHLCVEEGMCVMECVSYIAGEAFTDRPKCAHPELTSLAIYLNDRTTDSATRQRLLSLVLRLAGSKNVQLSPEDSKRVWHGDLYLSWEKGFALLDRLLPPLDTAGIAPEVEAKLHKLVEAAKYADYRLKERIKEWTN